MARWIPFATTIPKKAKATAGRTGAASTPVAIRTDMDVDEALLDDVRRRLARKVGKFAMHLERMSVRFQDVNGPKGGIDVVCRINAVLSSLPSVVVTERAADPALAFRRAADAIGRTLRRTLDRAGYSAPRAGKAVKPAKPAKTGKAAARKSALMRDDGGSLIGKRVGRSPADLEDALDRPEKRRRDAFVDTSQPGTSATDRSAGYGATAARNTKRNTAGMSAALEDSRTTPSRKSTRGSTNRIKAATPKQRTTQLAVHDPGARAMREHAHKGRPRGLR
ncbi:MAG: HPF/RaiA family ribosome-associated protein [Thermodesulfobacteriota bacterium]